ncbi:MAG: hypothetical protein PHI06_08515 [Desulfobulbaceae bacterium]|nr:hypothetical protein [Desulfobulbaceae bacterium]
MNTSTEKISAWDRVMMAVTFAEAGEPNTALDLLNQKNTEQQKDSRLQKSEQRPEMSL